MLSLRTALQQKNQYSRVRVHLLEHYNSTTFGLTHVSFKDYYQSELTALRQQAAVVCERNPALKAFIGQGAQDPDVERLLQSVSFLTGRLRQTIDDEFPEITHGLMQRLWPGYLRPQPSMSVVQFDPLPRPGPARLIARHSEVWSVPIQGIHCRFQTVFDTPVHPLELYRVQLAESGEGAALKLGIKLTAKGHLGELNMQQLRLHLAGELSIAHQLYRGLIQQRRTVRLTLLNNQGRMLHDASGNPVCIKLDPSQIRPVGFDDEQALLGAAISPQRGYRLLQEFFVFRNKFLFVDVLGLDAINCVDKELLAQASAMELRFEFSRYPNAAARPSLENVKLHCTPVVNLFRHRATPIPLEAGQQEYRLLPAEMAEDTCEIFAIDKVEGWKPGQREHQEYVLSESTQQRAANPRYTPPALYCLNQQPSVLDDGMLTTICFQVEDALEETVSIDLTCTNRDLPNRLAIGDIRIPGPGVPELLALRNICPATAGYTAPLQGEHLWKVISNLSLNYLSLENVEALKEILRTYDLPAFHDHSARQTTDELFEALHKVSHQNIDYLKRGIPVRGTRTLLEIRPKDAGCEAQWFLLGSVLSHFFALYASTHSFNQLQIKSSSGELWSWEALPGQQRTL